MYFFSYKHIVVINSDIVIKRCKHTDSIPGR